MLQCTMTPSPINIGMTFGDRLLDSMGSPTKNPWGTRSLNVKYLLARHCDDCSGSGGDTGVLSAVLRPVQRRVGAIEGRVRRVARPQVGEAAGSSDTYGCAPEMEPQRFDA